MKKRYFALVMAVMVTVSTILTDVGSVTAYAAEADTEAVAAEAAEETENSATEQQETTETTELTETATVKADATDTEADATDTEADTTETTEASGVDATEETGETATEIAETETSESTETTETETIEAEETEETTETEITEAEEDRDFLPTGLAEGTEIDVGEISEDELYEEKGEDESTAESSEVGYALYGSYVYDDDWNQYSTNYFYNQLDEERQAVWDEWNEMCLEFLTGTDDATYESSYGYYRLDYVSASTLSTSEMKQLYIMFRISNPQYYFLMYAWFSGMVRGNAVLAPIVYTSFASGSDRKTATANVKSVVTEWVAAANSYSSEADKVKVIHDTIANNVDYNNDFINMSSSEQTTAEQSLYTQSAYSVFCTDLTVCAGYSQAFEMVCNGAGIDCVAVTSSDHEWNKVRVNDSWYNVDVTWDDSTSAVYYTYFGRSDDYYDTVSTYSAKHHAEESMWTGYLPICSLDTSSTSSAVGIWPTISTTTAAPTITVTTSGDSYTVAIESTTSDADIYYSLDAVTPSVASTKSYKYTGEFTVDAYGAIKAMAACDGQWDSDVTTETGITYNIAFDGTGSTSGSMATQQNYIYGSRTALTANAFEKTGYTFTNWNTLADGSGASYADKARQLKLTQTSGKTVTLYAQWEETVYTITYKLNGGKNNSSNPSTYYISSDTITLKSPTQDGYTFAGWYSDSSYTNKVTTIESGSTGNVTLYAKWQSISYKVKFNGNGSTSGSMDTQTIVYGSGTKLTANAFKKKGYTFNGWNTKSDGNGDSYANKADGSMLTTTSGKTVTLYAQWKKKKYTITYKLNGGKNNSSNPSKYYITTSTITLKNPTRSGYTFKGWYSDSKFKTKVTKIKKGSTGNVTLYAKWQGISYKVKFNGNGSTSGSMKAVTMTYGSGKKLTANAFKKKGYTFVGWNTKAKGNGTDYSNKADGSKLTKTSGKTVTLYAQWKKTKYTITYKLNGGKNNSSNPTSYTIKTATITLKKPTKKGYTFVGWYSDSKCKHKVTQIKKGSTGKVTLYAKWKKK